MKNIPCNLRTFPLRVNRVTYYQPYLYWMKHLIERIGLDNSLNVWKTAFNNYDPSSIYSIFSSGWKKIEKPNLLIDVQILTQTSELFSTTIENQDYNLIIETIEMSPPINQIIRIFENDTFERETSAYDALLLRFDGQANLAETMIKLYGKQGELITYDIMVESRLASGGGTIGSINEFIEDFTTKPTGKTLFSASLDLEVVEKSQNSATIYVSQCEWARYFRENHPTVGYLLACSTDEVAYKAFNPNIKMTRTGTLMEGNEKCDFKIWSI